MECADVAKTNITILEGFEEVAWTGSKELSLQLAIDLMVKEEGLEIGGVDAVGFGDLWTSGIVGGVDGSRARVDRDNEWYRADDGKFGRLHGKYEMAEEAITTGGVDRGGVAVELSLCDLEGGMRRDGGGCGDNGESGHRKGSGRIGGHDDDDDETEVSDGGQ